MEKEIWILNVHMWVPIVHCTYLSCEYICEKEVQIRSNKNLENALPR